MKADTWLALCAAELEHLYLIRPQCGGEDVTPDWHVEAAGALIEAQRYRGLDPVQAARIYWRDNEATALAQ